MRNYLIILISAFLTITSGYADVVSSSVSTTREQNSIVNNTMLGNPQDWALTQEEWNRYRQLMQGTDGHWYPNLTPPEILGLEAHTQEEQQRFAEIVAKEEHDKLLRELAFDNAVHQAALRLYAREPVIRSFNTAPFNPIKTASRNTVSLQSGDHLTLFVDPTKGLDFMALPKLLAAIKGNNNVELDIFCVGNADESSIRHWAKLNSIPQDLVAEGRITLNQDNGRLQKTVGNTSLPYVLLIRQGESKPLSLWSLA